MGLEDEGMKCRRKRWKKDDGADEDEAEAEWSMEAENWIASLKLGNTVGCR